MFLLFDIGGTKMRLAISRDGENFGEPKILKTPKDFRDGMVLLEKTVAELAGGENIKAAAGGIAGPLDREKTKLVNSPNISRWIGKPLKRSIEETINAPVFLENDAAIVGLGEAAVGAGKGSNIVVYITVSTGIGGVRIVDGRIDRNALGFEPGHQIIDPSRAFCPTCNVSGHLEGYVSGAALEKRYHKKPYQITDPKIWEDQAKWLAYGLNNSIVHWSPDVVVLGGSIITKDAISVERVFYHLEKILVLFPRLPKLVKAKLGDVGGLYGALVFLKQNL